MKFHAQKQITQRYLLNVDISLKVCIVVLGFQINLAQNQPNH